MKKFSSLPLCMSKTKIHVQGQTHYAPEAQQSLYMLRAFLTSSSHETVRQNRPLFTQYAKHTMKTCHVWISQTDLLTYITCAYLYLGSCSTLYLQQVAKGFKLKLKSLSLFRAQYPTMKNYSLLAKCNHTCPMLPVLRSEH